MPPGRSVHISWLLAASHVTFLLRLHVKHSRGREEHNRGTIAVWVVLSLLGNEEDSSQCLPVWLTITLRANDPNSSVSCWRFLIQEAPLHCIVYIDWYIQEASYFIWSFFNFIKWDSVCVMYLYLPLHTVCMAFMILLHGFPRQAVTCRLHLHCQLVWSQLLRDKWTDVWGKYM